MLLLIVLGFLGLYFMDLNVAHKQFGSSMLHPIAISKQVCQFYVYGEWYRDNISYFVIFYVFLKLLQCQLFFFFSAT
jgi:hypothetical protein